MKIVEIINSLHHRGGAEVFYYNLCLELCVREDVELTVITLYSSFDSSFLKLKSLPNVKYYSLDKKSKFDFKAAKKLRNLLMAIKPNIVNFHLGFLSTYFLAFRFKKVEWKLVKTFHSIPGKDDNVYNNLLQKKYIKKQLINFIGISDKITQIAKELWPLIKIKTVYNGIPLQSYYQEKKLFDFIIVASLTDVKNHTLLFDVFKQYHNYTNQNLICLGGGPKEDYYREYLKINDMRDYVYLKGQVSDIHEYLSQSRIFILSSVREGNPISILEAMMHGLPIIAPRIGGIPDIVEDGVNGFLFDVNNKEQMLLCMKKLEDNDLYAKIKKENLLKSKLFDIKVTSDNYYKFFEEIING